jgi:cyclopropane fatty-acyl-phospholipid synthase-like methyltransferase
MINHSPSCERNKDAIVEQLKEVFANCDRVLEVGSGSGQHVIHFAKHLPHVVWQPMDLDGYFTGLEYNLAHCADNILPPIEMMLENVPWVPDQLFNGMFSANTLHIMSWDHVIGFFEKAGKQLHKEGILCIYGPFKYNGEYTSQSNANFQVWLEQRDPLSGVRDFEAVLAKAEQNGFEFVKDQPMPANNQLLSFKFIK